MGWYFGSVKKLCESLEMSKQQKIRDTEKPCEEKRHGETETDADKDEHLTRQRYSLQINNRTCM